MNVLLIGAGGQARVIIDILQHDPNVNLIGIIEKEFRPGEVINGIKVIGKFPDIPKLVKKHKVHGAIVGVGDNRIRAEYYTELKEMGLELINAIHPNASIAENVKMGDGNVICREAVICTDVKLGSNIIINSAAIVEHECKVSNNVHISPGVNIAGRVTVEEGAFVGIGTTIIQKINIGRYSIVGAGSIVLEDIPADSVAMGVPAEVKKDVSEDVWFGEQQAHKIKKNS